MTLYPYEASPVLGGRMTGNVIEAEVLRMKE